VNGEKMTFNSCRISASFVAQTADQIFEQVVTLNQMYCGPMYAIDTYTYTHTRQQDIIFPV